VRKTTTFLAVATLAIPAAANEVISFEEIPAHNTNFAALGEEYAHLGVHFVATDDGAIWDGVSNGDPGWWELEGTNGPSFVGFNGRSYSITANFDAPVVAFHVDVSAASGAPVGDMFALEGYRAGALVERMAVALGAVNQWTTVALTAEVDQVVIVGDTRGFKPFGVDNMGWGIDAPEAPPRLDVLIDVKPDSSENPVNPGSNGVLPVALLGSETFDVTGVDPDSLALGVNGAPAQAMELADVNGDGWMDLVAHYSIPATGTAYGDTSICLSGATMDGVPLSGCDAIRTVPKPAPAQKGRGR
jgi:hypothetical protein